LVGARTVRADNPRLTVRSARRRNARLAAGRPDTPVKVLITGSGPVDPGARFFTTGETDKLVYTTTERQRALARTLRGVATVVGTGDSVNLGVLLEDLSERGIGELLVEGGSTIHTQFLTAGLVEELHVVFAPFFLGEVAAPRLVGPGTFPQNPRHPMTLVQTRQLGDCVLLRYLPEGGRRKE
ncbi:MAG: RibD family protein, partial [Sciscionella sp.]